jgi:flagellar FliL protein
MAENEGAAAAAAPAPKRTKKLLMLAVAGVVVLAAAGVGGAWALGAFGGDAPDAEAADGAADGKASAAGEGDAEGDGPAAEAAEPIFVELPNMLVNLASESGGTRFLKLSIAVEVDEQATADRIERLAPRIVDSFQLYLRTLRADELRGPGAMFRLKEDLHVRIHQAIEPATVRDVLFKEMLVQ